MKSIQGIIIGAILAAAILQWGLWGMLVMILAMVLGYFGQRWWEPNSAGVMRWLRDGKRQINRGR
ncbi:DUF2273 domain-containing protein [Lacticaseibacillus brantae]|uniref:DUF2273 domain-containing protein n=1 Tax=Lacticaseibacillus brantae DSM 23927 TaxID=1423727 RepID=A0A0R2AXE9_9LACO|nr:DUF2273 domain-containing protein [Lacticaseibacillus brantae]KRM71997.1 hypothetical protein FC34_GL000979 [Lacticaseibacillus brantae DSM 23927]